MNQTLIHRLSLHDQSSAGLWRKNSTCLCSLAIPQGILQDIEKALYNLFFSKVMWDEEKKKLSLAESTTNLALPSIPVKHVVLTT